MIKGVNANHWLKAKNIKDQLSEGKNYMETGDIYDRNYLPSKIFLLYSYITGDNLTESQNKNKIVTDKKKNYFFIFSINFIFFYSIFSL